MKSARAPAGRRRSRWSVFADSLIRAGSLLVISVSLSLLGPAVALGSTPSAIFTYPTDGATNVDTSTPFAWTAAAGAQAYYLYVGSTRGGKELVDSRHLSPTTTSYQAPPLPTGPTLWARIWTEVSNGWTYEDVSFTVGPLATAYFAYPQTGATAVDPAVPFSWYPAAGAQQYYLDVGTSVGAKDLVDSNSLLPSKTSYQVPALPTGQTIWARIWTEVNGRWTYRDTSFVAAPPSHATFTSPQNGSMTVDTSKGFSWNAAPSAQAYYLYIGTSEGSKDVLDTGSLSAATTSYPVPAMPVGQTLWARLWTQVNGSWKYYEDVSFQVSISASRFTYPTQGNLVDTRRSFTWSTAPDAQAYYLWVGTSPGSSNIVDSGATQNTSWPIPAEPIGRTLYARIYTEINGQWNTYTEVSATVAYSPAVLSNPVPGQDSPNEDTSRPVTWAPVSGASAYYLWIGTSPGADDVLDSGALPVSQTSFPLPTLPAGGQLWVRLWTLADGTWIYGGDVPFTPAARIVRPAQQAIDVKAGEAFAWSPGAVLKSRSPSYELLVGTHPGGRDRFDSGAISTSSVTVPSSDLSVGVPLYARVVINLGDGSQRKADTVFAVSGSGIQPSSMIWGATGSQNVDSSQPFAWSPDDLAQAFRFEVSAGTATVVDSGPIHVSQYFAETLQAGSYTAHLGTEFGGSWSWTTSSFTVTHSGSSAVAEIAGAHWATDYVRHMADLNNYAYQWTDLWEYTNAPWPRITETCGVYALDLLNILKQMNLEADLPTSEQPKALDIAFTGDNADDHVIDEFWDSAESSWIVLDPTFDIAMQRSGDGEWASAQDEETVTRAQDWSAITYVPLGDFGFSIAKAYYLDYPLLYLNVPETQVGSGEDPTPYLSLVSTWPANAPAVYIVQSKQSSVQLVIDGQTETIATNATAGYSRAFPASSVAIPAGSQEQVTLYTVNRYVF